MHFTMEQMEVTQILIFCKDFNTINATKSYLFKLRVLTYKTRHLAFTMSGYGKKERKRCIFLRFNLGPGPDPSFLERGFKFTKGFRWFFIITIFSK